MGQKWSGIRSGGSLSVRRTSRNRRGICSRACRSALTQSHSSDTLPPHWIRFVRLGFSLIESRPIGAGPFALSGIGSEPEHAPIAFPQLGRRSARTLGLGVVLGSHFLAIWLLLHIRAPTLETPAIEALIISSIPLAEQRPAPAASPNPSEPTPATDPPPTSVTPAREWSTQRIPLPQEMSTSQSSPATSAAASVSIRPGAPDGGTYDPYAGVAPLRQTVPALPPPAATILSAAPSGGAVATLGPATRARLSAAVRAQLPRASGTSAIRLIVLPSGKVARIDIQSSSMSDQARFILIALAKKLQFGLGDDRILVAVITLP